jgi:uncharacterized membrane protein YidH (DUF202 family)
MFFDRFPKRSIMVAQRTTMAQERTVMALTAFKEANAMVRRANTERFPLPPKPPPNSGRR